VDAGEGGADLAGGVRGDPGLAPRVAVDPREDRDGLAGVLGDVASFAERKRPRGGHAARRQVVEEARLPGRRARALLLVDPQEGATASREEELEVGVDAPGEDPAHPLDEETVALAEAHGVGQGEGREDGHAPGRLPM
jgi:hypothetical protein